MRDILCIDAHRARALGTVGTCTAIETYLGCLRVSLCASDIAISHSVARRGLSVATVIGQFPQCGTVIGRFSQCSPQCSQQWETSMTVIGQSPPTWPNQTPYMPLLPTQRAPRLLCRRAKARGSRKSQKHTPVERGALPLIARITESKFHIESELLWKSLPTKKF